MKKQSFVVLSIMSDFEKSVEQQCAGLDAVSVGCKGPQCEHADGDEDHSCETYFSWRQCDSCCTTLGGDRSEAYGVWHDDGDTCAIKMSICTDCMMYHGNGELPDEWSAS